MIIIYHLTIILLSVYPSYICATTDEHCDDIARIEKCSASSFYNYKFRCENIFDGDLKKNFWSSKSPDPSAWVQAHLKYEYELRRLKVLHIPQTYEAWRLKDILLYFSNGTTYNTTLPNKNGWIVITLPITINSDFVRIVQKGCWGDVGFCGIAKVQAFGCHQNQCEDAKLQNVKTRDAMTRGGWVLNVDSDQNGYSNRCGSGTFWGYVLNSRIGSVYATFKGSGNATFNFGNCWYDGITNVDLNNVNIGMAKANEISTIVEFNYKPGYILNIREERTGIIKINSLYLDCRHAQIFRPSSIITASFTDTDDSTEDSILQNQGSLDSDVNTIIVGIIMTGVAI